MTKNVKKCRKCFFLISPRSKWLLLICGELWKDKKSQNSILFFWSLWYVFRCVCVCVWASVLCIYVCVCVWVCFCGMYLCVSVCICERVYLYACYLLQKPYISCLFNIYKLTRAQNDLFIWMYCKHELTCSIASLNFLFLKQKY